MHFLFRSSFILAVVLSSACAGGARQDAETPEAGVPDAGLCASLDAGPGLLLCDDFNGTVVDSARWHIPTWTPNGGTFVGQTQFRCSQSSPLPAESGGDAIIALDTFNPTGASFYGTDLISNQSFAPDQALIVTIRARFNAPVPAGIIGGLFLYAPPAPDAGNTLHDEIDFELFSNSPDEVWTNIYGNEPLGTGHPEMASYASGSATDFHTYQIRWSADQVSWLLDGVLLRTDTGQSPLPSGPMSVHFNIWVPTSDVAGAYSSSLRWTDMPGSDQTYSTGVDWVTVQEAPL